jgi:DNA-3-methyladenine glycosylase I
MKDYKAIFDAVEATVLEIGSKKVPREQILKELEYFKHLEGRTFTDDEYYTMLVHIVFYAGFKAQTVTDKIGVINQHLPSYKTVADYGAREMELILNDELMIRNRGKVQGCIANAKEFKKIIHKHGSFQKYIDSFAANKSDANLFRLKEALERRFAWLSVTTSLHFLTDIGMAVLKPDRVIRRIFNRLGLAEEDAAPMVIIDEGRKFAQATGLPIRYIDIIFVAYGQMQTREFGLERGICLEKNPSCSACGVSEHCEYYARSRRVHDMN